MRGHKYTFEDLVTIAQKYQKRIKFKKGNSGAYRAAIVLGVLDQICDHMVSGYRKWQLEDLQKEAAKYKTRWEFQQKNQKAYLAARGYGVLDQICKHMEYECNPAYTESTLSVISKKYKTRVEFKRGDPSAYRATCNLGIMDKIAQHMSHPAKAVKYSLNDLERLAEQHKTRTEFKRENKKAYEAAQKRGLLRKICQPMKRHGGKSFDEQRLFAIIQQRYPQAQSVRMRDAHIPNKLHIKGFEIDIYISELNKGIEFDGTYWHSFKAMKKKKNRQGWSDEDIRNYHQIKDNYFLSKGIKILHIREEDWVSDEQACVNRCFNFLSGDQNGTEL